MEDLTGKTLGQYQITGALGEGGMAAVYKAYQPGMDRYVALKILPRHFASDPQFVKRFEQEAKIIAKLQHPHILPVHDYGEQDGYTYIVMPFVDSGTLADWLQGEPLPLRQIKSVMDQVGDALDYAHTQGVLHRDIKPSNVLLDERGNCLLTDFGIGKILTGTTQLTRTGDVVGTPAYMSPEQGLGKGLDPRSDIYSLGVMLYEMITGRQPYKAETPMAVIIKHINDPLPPPRVLNPAVPEAVERVILKALAKDRDHRFSTPNEMVAALNAAITVEGSLKAMPTSQASPGEDLSIPAARKAHPLPPPAAQHKRRGNLPWIFAGIGAVGVVGVIVLMGILTIANRLWGNPAQEEVPLISGENTPLPALDQNEEMIPQPTPTDIIPPAVTYQNNPDKAAYVFDHKDLVLIAPSIQWKDTPGSLDANQSEIVVDPKGEFERVARLFVHGYGHGEQAAWITVRLDVPDSADIVLIPVATSLNGTVDQTDSESGLEILMRDPDSGQESWTYASYLNETQLGLPYVYAFADASAFQGRQAELTIRLRQIDVCAGSYCTQDADFYIGDLFYGQLPDLCTKQSNGTLLLYDYYDDPTPHQVAACDRPLSYYFLDVEDGPYNHYGVGENEYRVSFALPENSELIEFRMYYGLNTRGMTINNHALSPEEVYEAFPQRSGVYLNIPEPGRYSLFNNNPEFIAPFLDWGPNNFRMIVYTENPWEERPFDVFMRFKVPVP